MALKHEQYEEQKEKQYRFITIILSNRFYNIIDLVNQQRTKMN